jgi:hypothetical protein
MRPEIAARPIVWVGLAILAAVAIVIGSVFLLLRLWNASPGADRVRLPYDIVVPGPMVQSAPQLDLRAYRAEKQRLVESAAWLDAQRGIARIPVADAMALLAASAASNPKVQEQRP